MLTNTINSTRPEEQISKLLSLVGQPARIRILVCIGVHGACVCHLKAVLGMRQACISQHLMVLRKARLVTSHRNGRNMFYYITQPEVFDLLNHVAQLTGSSLELLQEMVDNQVSDCSCPLCKPDKDPNFICQTDNITKIHLS